jgi:uncharacterized protein (DUF1778 family)
MTLNEPEAVDILEDRIHDKEGVMGKRRNWRSGGRGKEQKPFLRGKDGSVTITIRLSQRLTDVLGATAAIFGISLEKYALRTLRRQARDIERESPPIKLSLRDSRRFQGICEDPSPPNAALRRAAKRYNEGTHTGRLVVRK